MSALPLPPASFGTAAPMRTPGCGDPAANSSSSTRDVVAALWWSHTRICLIRQRTSGLGLTAVIGRHIDIVEREVVAEWYLADQRSLE